MAAASRDPALRASFIPSVAHILVAEMSLGAKSVKVSLSSSVRLTSRGASPLERYPDASLPFSQSAGELASQEPGCPAPRCLCPWPYEPV